MYYRLNVVPFFVQPLRERKEDIPSLAEHFLKQYCKETQAKARRFDDSAMEILKRYDWPGNVRELKNIVERAAILSPSDVISEGDIKGVLPATSSGLPGKSAELTGEVPKEGALRDILDNIERNVILETLNKFDWNVTKASEALHLERSHLYKKMRAFGINRESEKKF